ncbi:reverse transcriptase [Tanacetum coccineum]|uniref:Reverse transcriptase n=1 Tax=Tanacetum coccineum TaxID=301880 RepID=A0ABQ5I0I9_9ASTR
MHLNLPVLEVLAHAPMYNAILDKYVKSLDLGKNRFAFIQDKMPEKIKDLGLFTLPCRLGDSKPFVTLVDLGSCVNLIPLYLFKIGLLEETDHVFGLADETKSYPVGIVKNVEVQRGRLKLLDDFYIIDMEQDPPPLLLVGRGFLATANAVIDCKKAKMAVGEGITMSIFGVKEISLGDEEIPYWTTLGNKWDSKELIKKNIDWNKPPKERDGAWHIRIELIDPDGEDSKRPFNQSPPLGCCLRKKIQARSSTWTVSMISRRVTPTTLAILKAPIGYRYVERIQGLKMDYWKLVIDQGLWIEDGDAPKDLEASLPTYKYP